MNITLKRTLMLCMMIACYYFTNTGAHTDHKVMRFIPAKIQEHNKGIFPFNKAFFEEIKCFFGIDLLVETGTYLGDSSAIARQVFDEIHTVELSEVLFNRICQRFAHMPGMFLYQGDSETVLAQILSQINPDKKIAILLDSHWSGGETAKGFDVPILRELDAIGKSGIRNCIIIIDDIRCFQNQPKESGDSYQYPDLSIIVQHIKTINPDYSYIVYGDLLIAYTDTDVQIPFLVQAMTISRSGNSNAETLNQAEYIIAHVNDQDFQHLAWLADSFDTSTGPWRTHYYDFWYALALEKRGYKDAAIHYMTQAAQRGYHKAKYYLTLWQ